MKKIIFILISFLFLAFFLPVNARADFGDACNKHPEYDISSTYDQNKKEYTISLSKINEKVDKTTLAGVLKCDTDKVESKKTVCKTGETCQIIIGVPDSAKGGCNIYVTKEEETVVITPQGGTRDYKKTTCSVPVQTIVLKGEKMSLYQYKKDKKKICGVKVQLNASIPTLHNERHTKYRVIAECKDTEGRKTETYLTKIELMDVEKHIYLFTKSDISLDREPWCPIDKTCTFTLTGPRGETIITYTKMLEEALKEASASANKIKPNDPCSLLSGDDQKACLSCMKTGGKADGQQTGKVWTVFGCVDSTGTAGIFGFFFSLLSYMIGGIATLLFIYASFLYMTSAGDAEKIKKAKTLMTAIVSGILFIIFSIMIMRFIGLTLFDLPTLKSVG